VTLFNFLLVSAVGLFGFEKGLSLMMDLISEDGNGG
jgi:hypothetical protein